MEILLLLGIFTVVFVISGLATYRFCRKKSSSNEQNESITDRSDENGH
jgi:hypothetical protein